jgi:hypothetical protein
MVACNAVFWNTENARWDGSEEIMVRSRAWITRTPRLSHVSLVSTSGLTTVILTLQGIQACFLIFASLNPKTTYGFAQGLPSVFLPLGCLGLMRLPAALWLSDDHIYLEVPETDSYSAQNVGEPSAAIVEEVGGSLCELDPLTSNRAAATAAVPPLSPLIRISLSSPLLLSPASTPKTPASHFSTVSGGSSQSSASWAAPP